MPLHQSKNLLDKINSLYQNISLDGEISSIERDLMLSYIRQFYEAILAESSAQPVIPPPPPAPKPVVVDAPIVVPPAPRIEVEVIAPPAPPVVVPEVIEVKPTPPPTPIPVVVEAPVPPAPKIEVEVIQPKPTPVFEQPVTNTRPIIDKPAPRTAAGAKSLIKPTVERVEKNQLFEEKMSKELSDKLGEMPIDDMRKGMGLNERIIFLNELFDGNNMEFENAINNLNNAPSFEDATQQLMILATRFDWSSKEKQAKPFIRLVKRRHNR